MNEHDSLQRFMFEQAPLRGEIVQLGASWKAVLERREYPPALRRLLGELLAASVLLAATLKFSGRLVLQMQGKGPLRLLVVECGSDLTVRAMAHWEGDVEQAPLPAMLGTGTFSITIEPKDGGNPYQGIVEVEGDSVAQALENYMTRSEQLETRLWLEADDEHAGGLLLQRLPGEMGDDGDAWRRAGLLAATLNRKELLGLPPRQIVRRLFHQEDIRLFDAMPVFFHCGCSRERVAAMLRLIGRDEVKFLLDGQGAIEVDCEFCNKHYVFDPVDAEQALTTGHAELAGRIRH
ncbi:MAG: Hsp33 family molecular chaperone HslO [Sulfuricellaceae bacterium]|nr:Hsp33 family molecular chaperone HslO [Sulfuricellaceae bacterium]